MAPEIPTAPPMDLRQLLYFVAVARELHFGRAAGRLHISPPGLSQQIKALERRLGVELLVRDTRHVRLTAAGEALAEAGQRLLADGELAVRQVREVAGLTDGQLRVAALHEVEGTFEPFLTRFHSDYPGVELMTTVMRHKELVAALRERDADAALTWSFLLHRAGDTAGLRWVSVAPTEVLAAVHPESPLAQRESLRRGEALRDSAVVLFERDYSPITFDYSVEQLYGPGIMDPPVREISVTVRAQEAMARHISAMTFAPLIRPLADMMRGTWEIRPFDPPWFVDGCVVWVEDNSTAAATAFMAAAVVTGGRGARRNGTRRKPGSASS